MNQHCFISLEHIRKEYDLPEKFTFPFSYEPHPLAIYAVEDLKCRIATIHDRDNPDEKYATRQGVGKMFGVLIVTDSENKLGYLSAFSGKWGELNHYEGFVPPIFDTLDPSGFYKIEEAETNVINQKISDIENSISYLDAKSNLEKTKKDAEIKIKNLKALIKTEKAIRAQKRIDFKLLLQDSELENALKSLDDQSIALSYQLKHLQENNNIALNAANASLQYFEQQINELKSARKAKSGLLQKRLFECYNFLNARGETKNLIDIFGITDETTPPSGAGECAAPKLLQFAFAHHLKPIVMAEFWYGNSPQSEIRKHGLYYPACNSKCKPILAHMLGATETDPNPMLINPAFGRDLPVIYEDAQIIIVNKPTEFLSVPGKEISDSVYTRILAAYPDITGPVIIHRLDMSTSGIMILARDKDSHFHIQNQFIRHKITKKYIALLDGIVKSEAGTINLPLRVDLDDRPRQVVCHTYGKESITKWERLEIKKNQTRIAFYPQTGRTHQLRVHSAHQLGLGIPIVGDDLYGARADRLFLHAAAISFIHPSTKQKMNIEVDAPF